MKEILPITYVDIFDTEIVYNECKQNRPCYMFEQPWGMRDCNVAMFVQVFLETIMLLRSLLVAIRTFLCVSHS